MKIDLNRERHHIPPSNMIFKLNIQKVFATEMTTYCMSNFQGFK